MEGHAKLQRLTPFPVGEQEAYRGPEEAGELGLLSS